MGMKAILMYLCGRGVCMEIVALKNR